MNIRVFLLIIIAHNNEKDNSIYKSEQIIEECLQQRTLTSNRQEIGDNPHKHDHNQHNRSDKDKPYRCLPREEESEKAHKRYH